MGFGRPVCFTTVAVSVICGPVATMVPKWSRHMTTREQQPVQVAVQQENMEGQKYGLITASALIADTCGIFAEDSGLAGEGKQRDLSISC